VILKSSAKAMWMIVDGFVENAFVVFTLLEADLKEER
jgi:hypothetical protein